MSFMRRRRSAAAGVTQRLSIFVAADIHGSQVCWVKFLNAGRFYGVDVVVLAGDITGKGLVPIVREPRGGFRVKFMGREQIVSAGDIGKIEESITFNGFYPYRCDPDEVEEMHGNPGAVSHAFGSAMREQLESWMALAEERLTGTGIRAFVMPGNDDQEFVSEILNESTVIENQDGRVIEVGGYWLVGQGWSNPTPWDTPREKPEAELASELRQLLAQVDEPELTILNPHVPPFDTGIDFAPELRSDLSMVTRGGQPNMVPVGSVGVREVIDEYQPLISLSGHIHESKGSVRVGRSTCVNPGSEYNVGRLLGALVELQGREVKNVQLVTG
jgi:Icc-related predicted phosphoesterase